MLVWVVAIAGAAAPDVELTWRGAQSTLVVRPPAGQLLAEDFPARVVLEAPERSLTLEVVGAHLGEGVGVSVGEVRGQPLEGALRVGLCSKATGVCEPRDFRLAGTAPDRRRGSLDLRVGVHDAGPAPFGPEATTSAADEALAAARADGRPVLLDFSAVWCPPCMALSAEVLHAADPPPELDGFHVAVVDVDHPSSFAYKDRYQVGSYPTVIAVDPEGRELSRLVGYPGREAFADWLLRAPDGRDALDLARLPSEVTPDRAAELAWALAWAGRSDEAYRWLDRAQQGGSEAPEVLLAANQLDPSVDKLERLLDVAPSRVHDWMFALLSLDEPPAELTQRVARLAIEHATPQQLPDALYIAAHVPAEPAEQRLLYAAAAAVLEGSLTGDPARDKAYVTSLAGLRARAGDVPGAEALLQRYTEAFPEEPTWALALARQRLARGDHRGAIEAATASMAKAWGDNRLTAAAVKAEALRAMGLTQQAAVVAREALDQAGELDAGLSVRSHRYRERLREYLQE